MVNSIKCSALHRVHIWSLSIVTSVLLIRHWSSWRVTVAGCRVDDSVRTDADRDGSGIFSSILPHTMCRERLPAALYSPGSWSQWIKDTFRAYAGIHSHSASKGFSQTCEGLAWLQKGFAYIGSGLNS